MQRQPTLTFHGISPSESVAAHVHDRIAALEKFCDRITGCHVTIEAGGRRHRRGNVYAVHVDVRVPGKELVVSRTSAAHVHADIYVAIRDAFDAATRQLEDFVRRRRDATATHGGHRPSGDERSAFVRS